MKLLIIAAGEGSRLRHEGIFTPKPLIRINGCPLIERLINMAVGHSFSEVCIIVNDIYSEVKTYINSKSFPVPIHLIVKSTPSSLHSFYELRHFVQNESFLLTTVDPVYKADAFLNYLRFIKKHNDPIGIMALTRYVDDEKPLWVVTENMKVTAYQSERGDAEYVSAGFYFFTPSVVKFLELAISLNMSKMRSFQQFLIDKGEHLIGFDMGKVIDIDHVNDINAAERLLKE